MPPPRVQLFPLVTGWKEELHVVFFFHLIPVGKALFLHPHPRHFATCLPSVNSDPAVEPQATKEMLFSPPSTDVGVMAIIGTLSGRGHASSLQPKGPHKSLMVFYKHSAGGWGKTGMTGKKKKKKA